jgi:gliding motility-associated-like protein
MKKLLLPTLLLLAVALGNAQSINVSTTSHTVPQLVNNILINSPCVEATNVTWRTGANFGSSNGIGYFTNTNPGFPMQSGVVMSTGDALNAQGPNSTMLSDGSPAWSGDATLEATLAAAGITMTSTNATVLEFDFTPISSHFNFDFVFASEEYGNFQCQFSDAFAFLLTNMNTGVTTNLAVIPSSNTPISVVTIRDFLYNSSCPSANSQYFGSFNGGSAAAGSATNFNGQTVLMNASSSLIPNTPYHIKLVVADRSDLESDSAIFINSDSFNIGQDVLGLDLTVANATAICHGQNYTLTTDLNPAEYTFTWTRNNAPISGATGPSITVTQPGNYGVTYTNIIDTCQPVTDNITIEYYPQIVTGTPVNLYKCDIGAPTYTYNLDHNTSIVKAGMDPLTEVSYFASQANAENNVSPLPLTYNAAPGTTIYIRVKNNNNNCFVVKSFQLLTSPAPVAAQLPNITRCARSLTQQNAFIIMASFVAPALNGQSDAIHDVNFYLSQANADAGINPITTPNYLANNNTVIYVRVQNTTDPSCYSTSSFTVFIDPKPPVDQMDDVIVCSNYVLPPLTHGNYFTGNAGTGTPLFAGDIIEENQTIYIFNQPDGPGACSAGSNFVVTIIDPNEMSPTGGTYCGSYTVVAPANGEYRTEANGGGTVIPAGTVITSSQTLHFYFTTDVAPFCVIDTDVEIVILPTPNVPSLPNVFDCVSYTLPPLSVGNYFTQPNGQGTQLNPGDVITSTQTIYIYAVGGALDHPCNVDKQFTVTIGMSMPPDIAQCQPYTLPVLASGNYFTGPGGTGNIIPGGTVISQSQMVYIYIPNSAACVGDLHFNISIAQPAVDSLEDVTVCGIYTLPALVNGSYYSGPGKTGTQLFASDAILTSQTIYIYAEIAGGGCSNESDFVVTVNPLPEIDSRSDIDVCNAYTLTELSAGNYYTGPNGTGTLLPAGTVITTSQTIYIYAVTNGTPSCAAQNSFELYIFSVEADQPANVVACDSYVLPALTIGDYYQNPGGPANNATMLHAGDVITASTTLYVYIESGERINCTDENSFTITINNTPVVAPIPTQNACNTYTLPALAVGDYYTGPGKTGTMLHAGDVLTTNQTVYVYAETGTTPNCSDEKSFLVNIFKVDDLADVTSCETYVLPALTVGGYYTGPNGTGTQLNAGASITTSQTIYVYAVSPFTPVCSDETSFVVTIVDAPIAHGVPAAQTTVCDEDGNNDGTTAFDLTQLNATILGSQTGAEFTIAYYATAENAHNAVNPITSTTAAIVYVRVSNTLAPSCYDVKAITIRVNKLPEPTPQDGIICFDTETQTLLNAYTMYSGLAASQHTFQWRNEAGAIVGTGSNYTALTPGVYTLTATRISTGCVSEPVSVTVTPSEPAVVAYAVTDDFADEQSITVIASGTGDYEYMLDNSGVWQDSPVFDNVRSGMHTITVRDRNGCGSSSTTALVVNYPKYFTPNGDGFHDTWNITDLKLDEQGSSKINIYDRYGKFLTQIKPAGNGWDGTYNGAQMPSTDYWFTVEYVENGTTKEFKAHFSMKR